MRRVATHRIGNVMTGEWLSVSVIELDEEGYVGGMYPLWGEISRTEWLPGVILLSPFPIERTPDESFGDFMRRLERQAASYNELSPCRAYWLTPFNLSAMDFTPRSRVVLLISQDRKGYC